MRENIKCIKISEVFNKETNFIEEIKEKQIVAYNVYKDIDLTKALKNKNIDLSKHIDSKCKEESDLKMFINLKKGDVIYYEAYKKDEYLIDSIEKIEYIGIIQKDFKEGYKFDKNLGHTLPVEWINQNKYCEINKNIYTRILSKTNLEEISKSNNTDLTNEELKKIFESNNQTFKLISYLYNNFDVEENKIKISANNSCDLKNLISIKKNDYVFYKISADMFSYNENSYTTQIGYARVKDDFDIKHFDRETKDYILEVEFIKQFKEFEEEYTSIISLSEDTYYNIYNSYYNIYNSVFDKNKNTILYGPPGTGKTYNTYNEVLKLVDTIAYNNYLSTSNRHRILNEIKYLEENNQLRFCTFHQSYGYEEFIEGLKSDGNGNFVCEDGVLKEIAIDAMFDGLKIENKIIYEVKKDNLDETEQRKLRKQIVLEKIYDSDNFDFSKANDYILVIDEINRGNISKIFGELITLIEDDKRLTTENEVLVKLPYSKESFCLPPNLYIVATMNTSDKSIALMDVALRRRFCFKEMMPNPSLLTTVDDIKLDKMLDKINQRIEFLYDKDYMIGHAYFINSKNICDISKTFKNKIIPLLQEYFYDDFEKIGLVLGGIGNSENDDYIVYKKEINPSSLFKENFDYEIKTKYYIKENIGSKELKNIYE